MGRDALRFDEIGSWSEIKLDILREYAAAYSTILSAQTYLHHAYIDGFSGPGVCLSRTSGMWVPGSPLNALRVAPPFERYFLVDMDGTRVEHLSQLVATEMPSERQSTIEIQQGDANRVLLERVFPRVGYESYWRALCVLDPYGLDLDWKVVETAGRMKSVDLFLNFPVMAMNREAFWANHQGVSQGSLDRMTCFWGDESWRNAAYAPRQNLFGEEDLMRQSVRYVVAAFRERLKKVAGFAHVPEPVPMRNSAGATIYYLFFASQKPVAKNIVSDIFAKYSRPQV